MRAWIIQNLKRDPGTTRIPNLLSIVLTALSGFILYSDKALVYFNIQFGMMEKFEAVGMDFSYYIWLLSQTVSPLLLLTALAIKWFHLVLTIPIYCYFLQFYFVFKDHKLADDSYLSLYAIGSTVLLLCLIWRLRVMLRRRVERKLEKAKKNILNNG